MDSPDKIQLDEPVESEPTEPTADQEEVAVETQTEAREDPVTQEHNAEEQDSASLEDSVGQAPAAGVHVGPELENSSPPDPAGIAPDPDLPLQESFSPEELLPDEPFAPVTMEDAQLKAVLEAIIYVTDEPLSLDQICNAIEQPRDRVIDLLDQLTADYEHPSRGLSIREVAGGFKMTTKPEHHEAVRRFVKNLNPPLKLSLPALETLAVIAYKQPITAPEIMEIRGVQGAGVLKTLIDRKLITTSGRKQVIGKPILYKTTKEFLVQFGLKDLGELPSLKEFEELARLDTEAGPEPEPITSQEPAEQEAVQQEPEHLEPEPQDPVVQTRPSSFLEQSPDAQVGHLGDTETPQPEQEP